VRYEHLDANDVHPEMEAAAEYRLSTSQRALRIDAKALASKLLTNLQPLGRGECITVQWIVSPAGPVAPARVATAEERDRVAAPPGVMDEAEAATALRKKQATPLLLAVGRIGVGSSSVERSRLLLRHVEVAWHESRAPGVHMRRRILPSSVVAKRIGERVVPLSLWPGTYNVEELAGLIGWPIDLTSLPGLVLGGSRQLAASPRIARTGTVIGESTFPGDERPLAVGLDARLRHLHVVGPTGTGKSTLLCSIIEQDLRVGRGVVLLDAKADLAEDVLNRIPKTRLNDVIVLDPADEQLPVGLNPLRAAAGSSSEVVVENLVGTFKSLYRSSWGPRTDDVMRAALLTLAQAGGMTLCEVPQLLLDDAFRRRVIGGLDDPVGLEAFWGWYLSLSEGERLNVVGPTLNKIRAVTMRPRLRRILGQAKPAIDLRQVLAEGKVLIVPLSPGLLGEEASALLGALVVAELWHATTARAGVAKEQRRPVMAVIDEWQRLVHLPTPMASVLAEARGLGLGLTLAHQSLSQLPEQVREAVMSNARSRIAFQLPASDARLIARDLGGILTADDLQGLGPYEVMAQVFADGATQVPATARTLPMGPATSGSAAIRRVSALRYGVAASDVEAAIRTRQTSGKQSGPIGRRPKPTSGGAA
jgi:hypothetical protein